MKPIIGITVDLYVSPDDGVYGPQYKLRSNYCARVREAGGNPVIIPTLADASELGPLLDGLLIPGGLDIDPRHFGQEVHPSAQLQHPSRYVIESDLFDALHRDAPVLGICYGAQFLNVKLGGTLHQHLPDVVQHNHHSGGTPQEYSVQPGTLLDRTVGALATGLSFHHQAVAEVAPGLSVSAVHEDGTVEAIEGEGSRWLLGVQWHPERTPESPTSSAIFEAFVRVARDFRARRVA